MNFNLVSNIESCRIMVESAPLNIVYYSHIPTAIVALFVGFFVFFKKRSLLASNILLLISIFFSLWSFTDIVLWIRGYNSVAVTFFWSILGLFEVIFFMLSLYFVHVFIDKKDINFSVKFVLFLLSLPVLIFTPTSFNVSGFDVSICEAMETNFVVNYKFILEILITLWIMFFFIIRYRKAKNDDKKYILYSTVGIILFLFSFSWSNIFGSITLNWDISQLGLFGMPVFMAFLAYLIVQYKAFNIKLIGAQALVVALNILIGSQFFFVQNSVNIILTGITLSMSLGFGYMLIKSVKLEVERKEQLQRMADGLAIANDSLRKLDNVKTEFISIASHQLRTPVTAIKGFISLILEGVYGELNKNVKNALEKVYISSERLVNLIEDLLNVSRIESGRMIFSFENAGLDKILKELRDSFSLVAKTKKLYLKLELPRNKIPEIKMDTIKIRELISNFIDNALKYTEKGGVKIIVEIKENGAVIDERGFVKPLEKSPYGKVVRITVSDTGIGVDKEEIPNLFKKFSRGKEVSRLHVGGTGLGLFVGKSIIDAHHGETWVESEGIGKGSKFIIEMPINDKIGSR